MTLDFPDKKELKGGLDIEFQILVPSTRLDKKISESAFRKRLDDVLSFVNKNYGGSTVDIEEGTYRFKGKTIRERVAVVTVYAREEVYNRMDEKLERYLKEKKRNWNQDSMGFVYEGTLVMV